MSYEIYIFEGRAGKDAEMRYTPSGQAVTSFSVAVDNEYTNSAGEKVKEVKWIRVSTWGKLAEICNQYVKRGMSVLVEGKLKGDVNGSPKIFTKSDGSSSASFEVTASAVRFLSGGDKKPADNSTVGAEMLPEDEIPF